MYEEVTAAGMGDFLKARAQTPLHGFYWVAGASCDLATNSESILEAARQSFAELSPRPSAVDFSLRFWVDPLARSGPPWPKPYYRGLDHLVFAGFDSENSLLLDLGKRRAFGRLSPALGADQAYWRTVIFPNLLTLLGPAIGVTELHCACVARDGGGILLCGGAGSGKSTLAFALARHGFSFLSDDWTCLSLRDGQPRAWGLATRLKLLSDAVEFFPELKDFDVGTSRNGERAYELEPDAQLGVPRSRSCEPRCLFILERQAVPEFNLTRMSAAEAAARLEGDLLAERVDLLRPQLRIIESLVDRGCWLLRYGGAPQDVAQGLSRFCQSLTG